MLIVDSEKVKSFGKMIAKHMNGRLEERFQMRKSLVKVVSFSESQYNGKYCKYVVLKKLLLGAHCAAVDLYSEGVHLILKM